MPISTFRETQERYARIRRTVYDSVEQDLANLNSVPVPVRLADIDAHALEIRRATWIARHWTGSGGWNWEALVTPIWRRPAGLPLAIWSGERLAGLVVAHASKRRRSGARHTLSLRCIEANPDPGHPLRRFVVPIALFVSTRYGEALGAERLRLIDPVPGLLPRYLKLGFTIAGRSGRGLYLERRIGSREFESWEKL
jgi:hypothetical protein